MDRAAWDAAQYLGLAIAGWVPLGRLAEDGPIPGTYQNLRETASADYSDRTTCNVRDTDATLILYWGKLTGGSAVTKAEADRLNRPVLAVDLAAQPPGKASSLITRWLRPLPGTRLNVAGPRASSHSEVYREARALLLEVFERTTR